MAPVAFELEAVRGFRLPEYAGALFRGGFGKYFRELVCVTGKPSCAGCPEIGRCAYAQVFESPVEPAKFEVLRKYPNAPHPFVLTPPLDVDGVVPARGRLVLEGALIGPGMAYLPHFARVFQSMGRSGRFGGRYELARITSGPDRTVVFDGATGRFTGRPELAAGQEAGAAVGRMRLRFVTPLRMRVEGRYELRPSFASITQALLRRIHLLSAIYGDSDGDAKWMHPLLAQADRAQTVRAEFGALRWDRKSGRTGERIQMDGVTGEMEVRGDLTSLAPYFRAGTWLHIGSATSMGMGRYELETGE